MKKYVLINGGNKMSNEKVIEQNENGTVTMAVEKPKWSLKKKLLIGGGVVAGLALGALALGLKKGSANAEDAEDFDGDDEIIDADVTDVTEIPDDTVVTVL